MSTRTKGVGPGLRATAAALLLVSCTAGDARDAPAPRAAQERPAPRAAGAPPEATHGPGRPSLQAFWTAFRKAAIAGDTAAVASLTRFPFRTRGELDSEPWAQHGRDAFPAIFSRLLRQDAGLSATEEPLARVIERTTSLPEGGGAGATTARLASLVFEVVDGTWRFTAAYLAEEERP